MLVGTVITRSWAPHARVWAAGLTRHLPGASRVVLVVDVADGTVIPGLDAEVLTPSALGLDPAQWELMRAYYGPRELCSLLKPRLLAHLLGRGDYALLLDADTLVLGDLSPITSTLGDHDLTLAPALAGGVGSWDLELQRVREGTYSGALVGGRPSGAAVAQWWAERTGAISARAPESGLFYEQRWLDLVATRFACGRLDDPGLVLLPQRLAFEPLSGHLSTGLFLGEAPVRLVHAGEGFDPASRVPGLHAGVRPSKQPGVAAIWTHHAKLLREAGWAADGQLPYGWSQTPSGLVLDATMRRAFRTAVDTAVARRQTPPPGPFAPDGGEAFADWLSAPADRRRQTVRLPRYLFELLTERPDLVGRFPHILGDDATRLIRWAEYAELDVPPELITQAAHPQPGAPAGPEELIPGVTLVGQPGDPRLAGTALALGEADVAYAGVSWSEDPAARAATGLEAGAPAEFDVNLLLLEPAALAAFGHDVGVTFRDWRYVIACWAGAPGEATGPGLVGIDEIWAASPALAVELAQWTSKPVVHLPAATTLPAAAERPPQPAVPVLGTVVDVARPKAGHMKAVAAAVRVAAAAQVALQVVIVNAAADIESVERIHEGLRGRAVRVQELAPRLAPLALAHCDAILALHADPETPPALEACVAIGLPVIAIEGAAEPEVLAYAVASGPHREPDAEAAVKAVQWLLGDRAAARALGAQRAQALRACRSPAVIGERIAARLSALTDENVIPVGHRPAATPAPAAVAR